MENSIFELLENGLYDGISLYNELLDCFKKESKALTKIDLDHLWNISKEKNDLCAKINDMEHKLFSVVRFELEKQNFTEKRKNFECSNWSHFPVLINDVLETRYKSRFLELYDVLQNLKSRIDVMRKVNTNTVEHSLQFLDEIISIITKQARQDVVYNQSCRYKHTTNNVLMSREV